MPTKDEVKNMPAGAEMDKRIIELLEIRIFDYPDSNEPTDLYPLAFWNKQSGCWCVFWEEEQDGKSFSPSTDIAAAWRVVEKMRDHNFYSQHTDLTLTSGVEHWSWTFIKHEPLAAGYSKKATAPTAPLAICRAALLAVMDGES
jgi:hypothetical protein